MKKAFFFILMVSNLCAYAQTKNLLDSLQKRYKNAPNDTTRILALIDIAFHYHNNKPDTTILISSKALEESQKINFKKGITGALNRIGIGHYVKGNYPIALDFYQKALKISEEIKDFKEISKICNNIAVIYRIQSNYDLALEYYAKSLEINQKNQDKTEIARSLNNLGVIHFYKKNYPTALDFYQKSLQIREETHDLQGIASTYNNIATVYQHQNNIDEALIYHQKSLQLKEQIKDRLGIVFSLKRIAEAYQIKKEYPKSTEYALQGLQIAKELKTLKEIDEISQILYLNHKQSGNLGEALQYLELHKQSRDSLFSVEKATSIANLESKMLLEKKEKELILLSKEKELDKLNAEKKAKELEIIRKQAQAEQFLALARAEKDKHKQDSLFNLAQKAQLEAQYLKAKNEQHKLAQEKKMLAHNAELEKQKRIQNTFFLIMGTFLVVLVLVLVGYWQKQKSNHLLKIQNEEIQKQKLEIISKNNDLNQANEELLQAQEEIWTKRDALEQTNETLELFKIKITQSIHSAQLIQDAVLPQKSKMEAIFGHYFVIYMPKDIVSGDFWWVDQLQNYRFLIVADCTGHGVSGAFMTIIGNSLLDRIIRMMQIFEPKKILEELNSQIRILLHQDQTGNNEGMDIAVLRIDKEKIAFSGAKRPLYLLKNKKIEKIEASRKSIGGRQIEHSQFEQSEFEQENNTTFYLCSDGYTDQNNFQRKKFSEKRMIELLENIQEKSLEIQKQILKNTILEHMKDTEQRDDITMIGFRLH